MGKGYYDEYGELNLYDVNSIRDIKENELIGVIMYLDDPDEYKVVIPTSSTESGEFKYDIIAEEGYESDSCIRAKKVGPTPLIMKKLNDNYAQELLSGEVFILDGNNNHSIDEEFKNDLRTDGDLKKFQEKLNKYKDNNFVMSCPDNEFYIVDDKFKEIYNKDTLPIKDNLIESIKKSKEQARSLFAFNLKCVVDQAQSIANTENVIYDAEKSTPKM